MKGKGHRYYPAFLDLQDKPCIVVGGGKVAERKAIDLISAGAKLTLISPDLTPKLQEEKDKGSFSHKERKVRPTDFSGAFLIIAATNNPDENERIAEDADGLVNVTDQPTLCNFIVPSTLRRGDLTIAVSTSGASPAFARAVKSDLKQHYTPLMGSFLTKIRKLRENALNEISDPKQREAFLKALINEDTIEVLRKGNEPQLPKLPPKGKLK